MPYLLPEVVDIEHTPITSVCVFFPDAPEYRAALLGALGFFTKWVAWERTADRRAADAALLWRIAHEMTVASWDNGCDGGDSDMDVNVNVNINNSCHYTGGGSFVCYLDDGTIIVNPAPLDDMPVMPVVPLPEGWEDEPILDPEGDPPVGFETWQDYDLAACSAANSMIEYVLQYARRNADFFGEDIYTQAAMAVVIVNLITGGWSVLFSRALQLKIVEVVGRLSILEPLGDIFEGLYGYVEQNRQELTCLLYQARLTAGDWENLLISELADFLSGSMQSVTSQGLMNELLSYVLPQYMAYRSIYDGILFDVPEPIDCSLCGEGEILYHVIFGTGTDWKQKLSYRNGTYIDYSGYTMMQIGAQWSTQAAVWLTNAKLRAAVGAYAAVRLTRVEILAASSNEPGGRHFNMTVRDETETTYQVHEFMPGPFGTYSWSGDIVLAPDDADIILGLYGDPAGSELQAGIDLYSVTIYGELV